MRRDAMTPIEDAWAAMQEMEKAAKLRDIQTIERGILAAIQKDGYKRYRNQGSPARKAMLNLVEAGKIKIRSDIGSGKHRVIILVSAHETPR